MIGGRVTVFPGFRLEDGDGSPVEEIGQYKLDTYSNLVCMPPYSQVPVVLDRLIYVQRIHDDGSISITIPITSYSNTGVWTGTLSAGFWRETKFIPYHSVTPQESVIFVGE